MTEATPDLGPLSHFGDVLRALDRLPLPVFAIGATGVVRWLNQAAEEFAGDLRGHPYLDAVAPQSRAAVRDAFTSKLIGGRAETTYEATLIRKDGQQVDVEISSVPIETDGAITGVFGVGTELVTPVAPKRVPDALTPRQAEVLAYLARGATTDEMARAMGVSRYTVLNHVRGVLGALGAHSRLEAVTMAHMRGLV